MKIGYESLLVLFFLMPGLLATLLLRVLVVRKRDDAFNTIIESLVLSFVVYVIASPFKMGGPSILLEPIDGSGAATSYQLIWRGSHLAIDLALAAIVTLVISLSVTRDLHMRFLRWTGVTHLKSGRSTWFDVFADHKCYVTVNLSDGNRVFGWPKYSSRDSEEGQIFLQDPAWVTSEGEYVDMDAEGILIVRPELIDSVIFSRMTARNFRNRSLTKSELEVLNDREK